ncbi:uncharacterized protein LOC129874431 [Solanum dulcamara]|uniref:uncharacterized protein LOC129874431 n=1 Tax=Solanum dulcamara TaxID=45834 RepID=UPI0024869F43|nr:uncharacterized protein LOC129874431 [Solanum dulcamara]
MKDRGKAAVIETIYGENNKNSDFNYSVSSDIPCLKHPNSFPIGICSFCLKEKLVNLICSNQFLSDETERNSSSSCSVEVGSVGRISFLLENEKQSKTEQVILLRSSSNSVEIKKNRNGFWKIKRFFKKNREKGDEKSEISGPIEGVVSRSRSLCSFRGGGGGDDGSSDYRFSSAKISDVTGGLLFDDFKNLKKKCCSDSPNLLPVLQKRTMFRGSDAFLKSPSNKTTTTTIMDDDDEGFIDLKLDLLSEPKLELFSESTNSMGNLRGGSCRMNEYDRRMKKGNNGKGNRVWKWIFKKSKRDEINSNLIIKS